MTIRRTRKKRSIGMVSDAEDFYQCDLAILDKLDAYREGDAHQQTDLFMAVRTMDEIREAFAIPRDEEL